MPDSLDYIGRFKTPQSQLEFIYYCIEHQSKFSFLTISVLIFTWAIVESLLNALFNDGKVTMNQESILIYGIVTFILGIIGVILCFVSCFPLLKFKNRWIISSYIQVLIIASMNFIFIVKGIERLHLGPPQCYSADTHVDDFNSLNNNSIVNPSAASTSDSVKLATFLPACPSDESFLSLFSHKVFVVLSFCPQFLMAIAHEPRLYFILIFHFSSGAIILASIFTSAYSILPYLIGLIAIAFLLTELHYQRVRSFITQRKLQQILEDNEKSADENHANEMRHMIGNVAHDLKTPLASFTNGLDIIQDILLKTQEKCGDRGMTPETMKECVSSIQNCLVNIRNTNVFMLMAINRCIDYTKASKGMKLVPRPETVDLREALQFPVDCMSHIQDRIGIQLDPLPEGICTHIITDKQWLQENLLCLLSNAVKYSSEGEVKVTASLTMEPLTNELSNVSSYSIEKLSRVIPVENDRDPDIDYLLFEIEDNGIGLSEEAIKGLFSPFKQAQRLAGGTGLGLYSLAKRMKALKGSYGVRKRKDGKQGSLFWFAIPYKPDAASAADNEQTLFDQSSSMVRTPKHSRSEPTSRRSSGKKSLEILIVDDAPSIIKMSSMMLKRQGHQTWSAENGEIALKKIEKKWKETGKGFDLILMDLQMPVMDGLEATRRLRMMEVEGRDWMVHQELASDRTVPDDSTNSYCTRICHQVIIGLSANSDHATANDALAAGVDEFFGKPFSLDTFNKMIERFFY